MSKRFFALTLALALTSVAPLATAQQNTASEAEKGPRLTLVEPVKDFGTVPKGKKFTRRYLYGHGSGSYRDPGGRVRVI